MQKLLPYILMFGITRACAIIISYDSYLRSDAGMVGESLSLITCLVLIVLCIFNRLIPIQERALRLSTYIACGLCFIVPLSLIVFNNWYPSNFWLNYSAILIMFIACNWLLFAIIQKLKGLDVKSLLGLVLLAVVVSELCIYVSSLLEETPRYLITSTLVLFLRYLWYKQASFERSLDEFKEQAYHLAFSTSLNLQPKFLSHFFLGIILLAIPTGIARSYPHGQSIAFSWYSQLSYVVLVLALALALYYIFVYKAAAGAQVFLWLVAFGLFILCSCLYFAVPYEPVYGAVFATALNIYLLSLCWYTALLLSSYGRYSPLFYYTICWAAYMIPRYLGRYLSFELSERVLNPQATLVVMCLLVLLSALSVFGYFLYTTYKSLEHMQNICLNRLLSSSENLPLKHNKLLGLPEINVHTDAQDLRRFGMQKSIAKLADIYKLTDREQEVLCFFALGYTQKNIAEELQLSPSTVHTHIKHVYSKTNLHSRQDLIDFLNTYSS